MQSKILFPVAVLLTVALLLAACPPAPVAEPVEPETPEVPLEPEEVTIQVYYPVAVDAPIADILQGYIDEFEAAYPNMQVEPVFAGGYVDVKTTIMTIVEGGGEPPALAVMLATDLYDLINGDYIIPLDDFIADMPDGDAYVNDFVPAFLANSYFEGQLWSIPFQRSVVMLYYNQDLLAEAGLEPPTDWASLGEAAAALTEQDNATVTRWGILYPSDWPYWLFQPLAIGSGQNIVGEDPTEVYFDHPDVIDAIEFYMDLSRVNEATPRGVQANWGAAPTDFAAGQAAMITHSSGSLAGILRSADFNVGVMPLPGKEEGNYATVTGGGNFYIMKDAPAAQQEAAWKFIEFVTQPELVADYSIQTGYIAARESAYEAGAMQEYLAEVPQAAQMRDALQYAGAELSVHNLGRVRDIFHDYLQAAFNEERDPADAMAAAQAEADEALEIFR